MTNEQITKCLALNAKTLREAHEVRNGLSPDMPYYSERLTRIDKIILDLNKSREMLLGELNEN